MTACRLPEPVVQAFHACLAQGPVRICELVAVAETIDDLEQRCYPRGKCLSARRVPLRPTSNL